MESFPSARFAGANWTPSRATSTTTGSSPGRSSNRNSSVLAFRVTFSFTIRQRCTSPGAM